MMDEQDLEGSRELLYKAVENLGPSGYINKINVNVLNIIYSTISDTYYYEEDLVSAQESLKIIVRNEQDSEDYIYYSVLLAEYYIETGEALLAEQVFDTIIPLYEASSEMFKTVMPWNRLDMLEASIAYNNKNYQIF